MPSLAPSLTVSYGEFSISSATYWARGRRYYEHDTSFGWTRSVGRLTYAARLSDYWYRDRAWDVTYSAGVRWRLK